MLFLPPVAKICPVGEKAEHDRQRQDEKKENDHENLSGMICMLSLYDRMPGYFKI